MVQSEDSAKFDGMPRSAIATGLADFILPPETMPVELLKFVNHPCIAEKKEPSDIIAEEEDAFGKIFRILNKKTNVDFTNYKPSTIVRRVERRMGIVQVHSLDDYLGYLHHNPREVTALFKDLLIGVTKFFRDQESFHILRNEVIPKIFQNAQQRENNTVRVWVAGCSTGEEAYSIAMFLQDYMDTQRKYSEVKVFATDIDRAAIEFAGLGLYAESIVADVDAEFLNRYFEKKANGYQVRRSIRELVVFAIQNLVKDPPFTKVDLISCRNLLIYLQPTLQKKVLATFNYAMIPGGYLFLGSSETIGEMSTAFDPLDPKNRIYRHPNKGTVPIREDHLIPLAIGKDLTAAYRMYTQPRDNKEDARRFETQENYYHALIRILAPAVLIVNEERELVQSFGNTAKYLKVPEGTMTLDVLLMLPREISLAASSGIHKVRKYGESVVYNDIRMKDRETAEPVCLTVHPVPESKARSRMFVLVIADAKTAYISKGTEAPPHTDDFLEQRIADLEQEVQFTRENLQATIEELQTANEELQATNEELLAANEELQSTNEELQSVNEELNTVNSEYQAKNIELTNLNNDMKNLMESTDIGTIFLDKNFSIRKYTPAMTRAVNLLPQDIGRPLSDLSIPILGNIMKDIKQVEKTSEHLERRISSGSETFLLRVLPFTNDKEVFDGIVITLVDISAQALAEKELQLKNKVLEDILEKSPSAQMMVSDNGHILFVNGQAEKLMGYSREFLMNMNPDSQEIRFANLDGEPLTLASGPLARIRESGKEVDKYILCLHHPDGQEVVFSLSGNPVFNTQKMVNGAIFKLEKLAHRDLKSEM